MAKRDEEEESFCRESETVTESFRYSRIKERHVLDEFMGI